MHIHDALTDRIVGCAFTVSNTLGVGFLEKVYENALAIELRKAGLNFRQQHSIPVRYDGQVVGDYHADLIVEDLVVVELKATKVVEEIHIAQVLNDLRATELSTGLLLNFGTPKVQVKRLSL